MFFLPLRAYLRLVRFDLYLARGNFARLQDRVRNCPVAEVAIQPNTVAVVCSAMEIACIWYWKRVLCLQRSAATACLLREYGVRAQLVIGAQQMPFRAHAWVEVEGRVVNDKSYIPEIFEVLDKC